jgi:hypothetical protein
MSSDPIGVACKSSPSSAIAALAALRCDRVPALHHGLLTRVRTVKRGRQAVNELTMELDDGDRIQPRVARWAPCGRRNAGPPRRREHHENRYCNGVARRSFLRGAELRLARTSFDALRAVDVVPVECNAGQ